MIWWKTLCVTAAALAATLAGSAAQAEWLKAETPNFVVYGDGSPTTLKRYAQKLEAYDAYLRARYGVQGGAATKTKLHVYLVDGPRDLRRARPALPDNVVGVYVPGESEIFAVAIKDGTSDLVVQHEYAHHFQLAHFPFAYPAWLIEGWAEYYGTFEQDLGAFKVGAAHPDRLWYLLNGRWAPMRELLATRPIDFKTTDEQIQAYGQSWALTHYLLSDENRAAKLAAYLRAVERGEDSVKAMEAALGEPIETLEKTLAAYLRRGLPYQQVKMSDYKPVQPTVTPLPASTGDLMLLAVRLKGGVDDKFGPETLAAVRAAAAKHPGDPFAMRTLANAQIHYGDLPGAAETLKTLLAAQHDDVEGLQLEADRLLHSAEASTDAKAAQAMRRQARSVLGRAHKLDGLNYTTLAYYARARRGDPDYPTDEVLETLLLAHELAPQVHQNRFLAAQALVAKGRRSEAAALLNPLLKSPHDTEWTKAAQDLLADAPAADAAAATTN